MQEILTPTLLWADFNQTFEGKVEGKETDKPCRKFAVTVFSGKDGDVVIDTEVYEPERKNGNIVLLLGDFERKAQSDVIDRIVKRGCEVIVPDYSGVFENTLTKFPESLKYGYYEFGGEHLTKVCPTARETSFYLYTKIIRKIISAIKRDEGADIVVMGLKRGAEIALQTVGTDKRPIGLALIAGAGYREYVNYPKFDSDKILKVEGELMKWITAVSGTAYAKKVTVPTMIAVGSNGTESDIDRVQSLMSLIEAPTNLAVSTGYRDNIDKDTFDTVLKWLDGVYVGSVPPKTPTVSVSVNAEGEVYCEATADADIGIKEVKFKFSFGDNNHSTRFWRDRTGAYIGDGAYIAKLRMLANTVFVYAEVEYLNGYRLCSGVVFADMSDRKAKKERTMNPIVFQYPYDSGGFVEISDDTVIMKSSLTEGVLPIGLKGLRCDGGGMVSYSIGDMSGFDSTRLLQIDTYSDEKNYVIKVSLVDKNNVEYIATKETECTDTYSSVLFNVNAFKDKNMRPLEKWESANSLTVLNSGVTVGKIMFI